MLSVTHYCWKDNWKYSVQAVDNANRAALRFSVIHNGKAQIIQLILINKVTNIARSMILHVLCGCETLYLILII
jgi:hypothetical protein